MKVITLADGTYSYARPALGGRDDAMTATIQGGHLVAGTLNGQPMTGHCWTACTLDDLAHLPYSFEWATIGKARASRLHRILSRLGHADHYRAAICQQGNHWEVSTKMTIREPCSSPTLIGYDQTHSASCYPRHPPRLLQLHTQHHR